MNGVAWRKLAGIETAGEPSLGPSILGACISASASKTFSQAGPSGSSKKRSSEATSSSHVSKQRRISTAGLGTSGSTGASASSALKEESQDSPTFPGPDAQVPEDEAAIVGDSSDPPDAEEPPDTTGVPKTPAKRGDNGKSKSLTIKKKLELLRILKELKESGEYKYPEKADGQSFLGCLLFKGFKNHILSIGPAMRSATKR